MVAGDEALFKKFQQTLEAKCVEGYAAEYIGMRVKDHTIAQERLTIPHPRMRERAFVLVPLQEIAPTIVDPITGQTIQQLAQAISHTGVTKVATHW